MQHYILQDKVYDSIVDIIHPSTLAERKMLKIGPYHQGQLGELMMARKESDQETTVDNKDRKSQDKKQRQEDKINQEVKKNQEEKINQEIKKKMVCTAERRSTGGGRRRRRGERRDVMEQYRKLRLVLPNINSRGKISKQIILALVLLLLFKITFQHFFI